MGDSPGLSQVNTVEIAKAKGQLEAMPQSTDLPMFETVSAHECYSLCLALVGTQEHVALSQYW